MFNEIQVITQLPNELQWVNGIIVIVIVVLNIILISEILMQFTKVK